MSEKHDKVYTLAEASEQLRLTNRAVAKIAKAHGLCMVHGRTILLTDADIESIKDVLRVPPTEQRPAKPEPYMSDKELSESLQILTAGPKRRRRYS